MKKGFLALACGCLFSFMNAGFFIGASGEFNGNKNTTSDLAKSSFGFGVNLGSDFFVNNYLGARFSLNLGYEDVIFKKKVANIFRRFEIRKPNGNGFNLGSSIDVLLNFYSDKTNSFGIFAGAGVSYSNFNLRRHKTIDTIKSLRISELNYNSRIGLTFSSEKHRLDIYASAPFYVDKFIHYLDSQTKISRERNLQKYEIQKIGINYYYYIF